MCCEHPFYICAQDPAQVAQDASQLLNLQGFADHTSPRILEHDGSPESKLRMLRKALPTWMDPHVHWSQCIMSCRTTARACLVLLGWQIDMLFSPWRQTWPVGTTDVQVSGHV